MCLFIVAVHAFAYANAFACVSNQMLCIAMEWNGINWKKIVFLHAKKRMPNSQRDQGATRTPLDYHYYYHYCDYNKLLFE